MIFLYKISKQYYVILIVFNVEISSHHVRESVQMKTEKDKRRITNNSVLALIFLVFIAVMTLNIVPTQQTQVCCDKISSHSPSSLSVIKKSFRSFLDKKPILTQSDKYQSASKSSGCTICYEANVILFPKLKTVSMKSSRVQALYTKRFIIQKYYFKDLLLKKRFSYVNMSPPIHKFLKNVIIIC